MDTKAMTKINVTAVQQAVKKVMTELGMENRVTEVRKNYNLKGETWEVTFDGTMDGDSRKVVAELTEEMLNIRPESIKWVGLHPVR